MGEFASAAWVKILAWGSALIILGLNFKYVADVCTPWVEANFWRAWLIAPPVLAVLALLGYVSFTPQRRRLPISSEGVVPGIITPVYRRILVPLDHTARDRAALAHAAAMARQYHASLHLMHVEEGAISRLFGPMASGAEVQSGEEYFQSLVDSLEQQGSHAEFTILHGQRPKDAIVQVAREQEADLIVMRERHGHRGFQDLIFGNTINGVRHEVKVPVLVVGDVPK